MTEQRERLRKWRERQYRYFDFVFECVVRCEKTQHLLKTVGISPEYCGKL